MLQNRVDPFGNIFKTTARGSFTGTRGIIHNDHKEITRAFRHQAWITCLLEFKGRRRQIMAPNRYTELFFFDEATAFAAGHRPCAECRRSDFIKFKSSWISGNVEYGFDMKTSIRKIDAIIHQQRIDKHQSKITFASRITSLPPGSFVSLNNSALILYDGLLHPWTPFGYQKGVPPSTKVHYDVLTPHSVVNAFRAGYLPQINIE